ncbi:hypothetical protein [Clostridium sp. Cult3]|uniref:hypothetical protein n=1 Tax=Clostridium sp. Cult3 TaxID=2079004 RepID=UPI001F2C6895|nr:hypothetical protein [Clostridium sp. Cult3]MCF6461507.1 hypothetical protein [Clostridium sp. Cult3]
MKDKIKRLKNNEYALRKAYSRLENSLENRNEKDIYSSIGELLLWVLTTDEWHIEHNDDKYKNRRNNDINGQVLSGLRYAYNLMKHNMDFYTIHREEGGMSFPISFPLDIPEITINWKTLNKDMESGYESQIRNYKKCIQGKTILETFDKAIKFLDEENRRIKKQHDK